MKFDRDLMIEILTYHYRKDISSCGCGWSELGKSHPEHVVNIYEDVMRCNVNE